MLGTRQSTDNQSTDSTIDRHPIDRQFNRSTETIYRQGQSTDKGKIPTYIIKN